VASIKQRIANSGMKSFFLIISKSGRPSQVRTKSVPNVRIRVTKLIDKPIKKQRLIVFY